MALGQLEGVSSIGEVGAFTRAIREHKNCTCGIPLAKCVFWGEFIGDEQNYSNSGGGLKVDNVMLFAFGKSRARYLVDSTKTSYKNFLRPYLLDKQGYDVYFIHLVRNLFDVIESAKKGANSALEKGVVDKIRFVVPRTILSWALANTFAFGYRFYFRSQYLFVNYKSMVSDPEHVFRAIGELLGKDMHEVLLKIDAGSPLSVGHEINGNRLLRSGPVVFKRVY